MTVQSPSTAQSIAGNAAALLVGTLISIYIVSQFLRNSIGVIAPNLAADLGLSAAQIGLLSSIFFFSFAAVQIPLGMALDRFGPRRCLLVCAVIIMAGIAVFAYARTPGELIFGRMLLGIGASSAFMAPLAIYARRFPPQQFASLTGLQIGIGTFGALIATAPLAFATAAVGWRMSFLAVGVFTLFVTIALALVVKDDGAAGPATAKPETLRESLAGIVAVLRTRSVWPVFGMQFVAYSSFVLVVGLWGGPYLTHIYGYTLEERGAFLLIPVLAQIIGSLLWGPTDRLFGSHKFPVLLGGALSGATLGLLAFAGTLPPAMLVVWFAVFGFLSAYAPVLIAHGKALFPAHLVGRGLTIFNIASMGGVFVVQAISGIVIGLFPAGADGAYPHDAYRTVFGLQVAVVLLAMAAYLRAHDPAKG
jgi:MFS family permease